MPSIDAHFEKVEQDQNGFSGRFTDDPRVKRLDTKREEQAKEAQALMRWCARPHRVHREGEPERQPAHQPAVPEPLPREGDGPR